jgi:hypothetical protein
MRGQLLLKRNYEPEAVEAARAERARIQLLAWVKAPGGGGPLKITDISRSGFGGVCQTPVPIGGEVGLNVPGAGPVRAQVRWALGGVLGARFVPELSEQQFDACLSKGFVPEEL